MFQNITPAVKNLLIINVILFAAEWVFRNSLHIDLATIFGLHYLTATHFGVWQFVTYMFMHSGVTHLFCNMLSLFFFGPLIERSLGLRRFLTYYFVCGIGAGILQEIALYFEIHSFITAVDAFLGNPTTESLNKFINGVGQVFSSEASYKMQNFVANYNNLLTTSADSATQAARHFIMEYQQLFVDSHNTVGASGAVFGLLLAVAMLYPELPIFLMFIPIPIKAKYFVGVYALFELVFGVADFQYDNVAHWAHLGGMLFGFLLLYKWKHENA